MMMKNDEEEMSIRCTLFRPLAIESVEDAETPVVSSEFIEV